MRAFVASALKNVERPTLLNTTVRPLARNCHHQVEEVKTDVKNVLIMKLFHKILGFTISYFVFI